MLTLTMPTATAHSVLAADLAEFRLQPETLGVRPPGGDARGDDVLGVRQRGRVEHDGSEAAVHWAAQQPFVGDVVEVQRHGNGGRLGERGGGAGHRGEPAAVEPHGVLADLADDRAAHGFRPGDHGLGMLQGDHVERADGPSVAARGAHHIGGGSQRHGRPPGAVCEGRDSRSSSGRDSGSGSGSGSGKDLRDVQGFVRLRTIKHLIKRCGFMGMRISRRTSRTGSCETWRHRRPGGARCWRC
jgi:hypothetical protein